MARPRSTVTEFVAVPRYNTDRAKALGIAIAAGLLLLVGSFVGVFGDAGSAAFGGKIIEATLSEPIWGTALGWRLAGFVGALVLVHSLLGALAWALAHLTKAASPASQHGLAGWTLVWFLALALWVLVANAAWFPQSSLGRPYASAVKASFYGVELVEAVTIGLLAAVGVTLALALARFRVRAGHSLPLAVLTLVGIAGLLSFGVRGESGPVRDGEQPHVIFIGLDSVRVDAVGRGGDGSSTPTLDRFLANSTVFSDAVTPLARTFPAWVSIVSGRHPHTTGAVMNLLPRELIDEGDTLPTMLRKAGYRTVYATDEVRFSNLDESYGFDEMIAPPIGSADFILGFFGDSP